MKFRNFAPNYWWGYFRSIYTLFFFEKPSILIGGCGRTGTSLMSAILGAHPLIVCLNYESYFFSKVGPYQNPERNKRWRIYNFYARLIKQGIPLEKRRWCEKTPRNVLNLKNLFSEYGNEIKVILMIRNPFDVLTSRHPKSEGYYISTERWLADTLATLQFRDHPKVLIIPYEGLIDDFEYTMKKVCVFLNISFTHEIQDFHKNTSVRAHDAFQGGKVKALYRSSLDRWNAQEHKERIDEIKNIPELKETIDTVNVMISDFLNHK